VTPPAVSLEVVFILAMIFFRQLLVLSFKTYVGFCCHFTIIVRDEVFGSSIEM
jgi:hypothetical protein